MKLKFNRNGFTLIELLVVVVIVVIFFGLIAGVVGRGCSSNNTYSQGTRVGIVTKLSQKGTWSKTWEGEMVLGGVRAGAEGGVQANVWAFTVPEDRKDLVDAVQHALDTGKTVRIKYVEKGWSTAADGDTRYRVTEVAPIEQQK